MLEYESQTVISHDGVSIHYHSYGEGENTFVLAPGLCVSHLAYHPIIDSMPEYRFITWHARGTYESSTPLPGGYRVEDHMQDLLAICEQEQLEKFVLGGWSLGVMTSLLFAKEFPERCAALVLIHGPYRGVLQSHLGFTPPGMRAFTLFKIASPIVSPIKALFFSQKLEWLKPILRIAHISENPDDHFMSVMREWGSQPLSVIIDTVTGVEAFDASEFLEEIEIPALVTAGSMDPVAPQKWAKQLASKLPNSNLEVFIGGTHYTLYENYKPMVEAIRDFLSSNTEHLV